MISAKGGAFFAPVAVAACGWASFSLIVRSLADQLDIRAHCAHRPVNVLLLFMLRQIVMCNPVATLISFLVQAGSWSKQVPGPSRFLVQIGSSSYTAR